MRRNVIGNGISLIMGLSRRIILAVTVMALSGCSDSETATTQSTPPAETTQRQAPPVNPDAVDAVAQSQQAPPSEPAPEDPEALKDRGRAVYAANCIACHNSDPSLDGGIGPAIAGSSLALLEARIMRNAYPEGYKPKRETSAMIALPYLEKDLDAIAAFLAK
jgi:mono/diheme cytochrome c family protein